MRKEARGEGLGDLVSVNGLKRGGKAGMNKNTNTKRYRTAAVVYITLFSLISLSFLTLFPYVHSDESWLAGLTRAMMTEKSPAATEPFFDAKPRHPHSIKILFHLLQMIPLSLFGYSAFSVRLVSWAAGAVALWFAFLAGGRLLDSEKKGLLVMAVFSADIQFLYASHFARQEILLCMVQWICLWILLNPEGFYDERRGVGLGILTGLSIGLHPNSFLLGCMNGCCFLAAAFMKRKGREGRKGGWKPLLLYVLTTGGFAAVFVGMSLGMDREFVRHYAAYGQAEFGTGAPFWEKIGGFFGFLRRLYERNSGTYYLPDIRPQFFFFGVSALAAGAAAVSMREEMPGLAGRTAVLGAGALGIAGGMMCIGRYNQTSVLFFFPFGYLAAAMALELYEGRVKMGLWAVLGAAVVSFTAWQAVPEIKKTDYDSYGRQIAELVPEGAKVLGNLNMEFFTEYGCLRDYRNLPYALEGEGLLEYLDRNEIEYIVYHEELDYLWEHRPYYNVIYGNVMFVRELRDYCEEHCQVVGSFQNSRYGIRVAGILGREEYGQVTVYRRASSSSSRR